MTTTSTSAGYSLHEAEGGSLPTIVDASNSSVLAIDTRKVRGRVYSTPVFASRRFADLLLEVLNTPPSDRDAATVTVPSPTFGSETRHAPQLLVDAAWKIRNGYTAGGSTVVGAVARLLDDVAAALDPTARTTYDGRHPILRESGEIEHSHLTEMTYEERQALPAVYHRPVFYDMATPASWVCAVCWDDGLLEGWPCRPATGGGATIAADLGLEHVR